MWLVNKIFNHSILLLFLLTDKALNGQFSFPSMIARQSKTYASSTADRAIDNNPSTCSLAAVGGGSSDYGWWQVDLGDVFTVYSVTVTSGTNDGSLPMYAQNFAISVGITNSTEVVDSNVCYYFNNGSYLAPGIPTTFPCSPNPINGRYVTLKRRGGFRQDAISLCDVNILYYTVGLIRILYLPTNQTGGYTDQYGVFHGSDLANDWNLQTCSQPFANNGNPIWYIDLQDVYTVDGLIAFNQDSNANFYYPPDYLSYFNVRVGNSPDLSSQTQCCYYGGVAPVGGNASCNCQSSINGRYVSIERVAPQDKNPKTLVVCEVLIRGHKGSTPTSTPVSSTSLTSATASTLGSSSIRGVSPATLPTYPTSSSTSSVSSPTSAASASNSTSVSHVSVVAAIVLGILFGLSIVLNILLIIYILKKRHQSQSNVYETPKTNSHDQPNSYEQLRRIDRSSQQTHPEHVTDGNS